MNNEIKEILKIEVDCDYKKLSVDEIITLKDYITNLQQKVEQYENPDDLTLFYMWLDEKAKDKMKQLQQENDKLLKICTDYDKQANDYKARIEKAFEYINKNLTLVSILDGKKLYGLNDYKFSYQDLLNILQGEQK